MNQYTVIYQGVTPNSYVDVTTISLLVKKNGEYLTPVVAAITGLALAIHNYLTGDLPDEFSAALARTVVKQAQEAMSSGRLTLDSPTGIPMFPILVPDEEVLDGPTYTSGDVVGTFTA